MILVICQTKRFVFQLLIHHNIAPIFPSTPENIKIANIINYISDQMPVVGKSVIFEILQTLGIIFSILVVIKIYKLIPFKAT